MVQVSMVLSMKVEVKLSEIQEIPMRSLQNSVSSSEEWDMSCSVRR